MGDITNSGADPSAEEVDAVPAATPMRPTPRGPSPDDAGPPSPMASVSFTASDADLVNPERGFYVGLNLLSPGAAAQIRSDGHALAIAQVQLDAYRDAPLDDALLVDLAAGFAAVRAAGIKVILRFRYNSDFGPDAPKARILAHIAQLTPLLQANADVIAVMQAGFIGAWGEWHSSTNGLDNDVDRADILNALLAAVPAERAVQVRTPMFKEVMFGPALTEAEAYGTSPVARVGHHNDCFLASATDFGTYASPADEAYLEADGAFTPMGGETCAVYPDKTACAPAQLQMRAKHWSYLNLQYNQTVIAGWAAGGCEPDIRRDLGYRFALQQADYTAAVAPGGELEVRVDLVNHGYAAPYNLRPVYVVLSSGTTRQMARLTDVDARRWRANEATTVTARLRIPADLAPGSYSLSLWLPDSADTLRDDPRYAIQLANDGVWNDATGDNLLTNALSIDPAAGGPVDPSATVFAEI